MIEFKLMHVITSYTPLSTNIVRLIPIQIYVVIYKRIVRFTDNVQRNLSRCVQVYKYWVGYDIYYETLVLTLNFLFPN